MKVTLQRCIYICDNSSPILQPNAILTLNIGDFNQVKLQITNSVLIYFSIVFAIQSFVIISTADIIQNSITKSHWNWSVFVASVNEA